MDVQDSMPLFYRASTSRLTAQSLVEPLREAEWWHRSKSPSVKRVLNSDSKLCPEFANSDRPPVSNKTRDAFDLPMPCQPQQIRFCGRSAGGDPRELDHALAIHSPVAARAAADDSRLARDRLALQLQPPVLSGVLISNRDELHQSLAFDESV